MSVGFVCVCAFSAPWLHLFSLGCTLVFIYLNDSMFNKGDFDSFVKAIANLAKTNFRIPLPVLDITSRTNRLYKLSSCPIRSDNDWRDTNLLVPYHVTFFVKTTKCSLGGIQPNGRNLFHCIFSLHAYRKIRSTDWKSNECVTRFPSRHLFSVPLTWVSW